MIFKDSAHYYFKHKLEEIQKAKDGSFADRLSWYLFYIQERYDFADSRHLKENLDRDLDEAFKASNKQLCLPKQMNLGDQYNLIKSSFALFVEKEMRDYKKANRDSPKQDKEIEDALWTIDMAISLKHDFDFLSLRPRRSRQDPHHKQVSNAAQLELNAQKNPLDEHKPQRTHISENALKRIVQRAVSLAHNSKS